MDTPESKYLVVSVRKVDGQTFFPDERNHRKGIDSYDVALEIAKEKALNNSTDYSYVVYICSPVTVVEKEIPTPPLKIYSVH